MKAKQELKEELKLIALEKEALKIVFDATKMFFTKKIVINIKDIKLKDEFEKHFEIIRMKHNITSNFLYAKDSLFIDIDIYYKHYKFSTSISLAQHGDKIELKDVISAIVKEENLINENYKKYKKAIEQYDAYVLLETNMVQAIKRYNSTCNLLVNDLFDYADKDKKL